LSFRPKGEILVSSKPRNLLLRSLAFALDDGWWLGSSPLRAWRSFGDAQDMLGGRKSEAPVSEAAQAGRKFAQAAKTFRRSSVTEYGFKMQKDGEPVWDQTTIDRLWVTTQREAMIESGPPPATSAPTGQQEASSSDQKTKEAAKK